MNLLTQIFSMLGVGIAELGRNIGTGIGATAKALFIEEVTSEAGVVTQNLSSFGVIIVVFAAVGLAIGATKLVTHFIMSLGGKSY